MISLKQLLWTRANVKISLWKDIYVLINTTFEQLVISNLKIDGTFHVPGSALTE